jgi:hypothetical protein
MIKCPFCHFENEDGALFCERCTSDLTAVAPAPAAHAPPPPPPPPRPAVPPVPSAPTAQSEPIDHLFAGGPVLAEAVPLEVPPLVTAEPIDAIPIALEQVPESAVPALEKEAEPPPAPPPPAPAAAPPAAPAAEAGAAAPLPAGAQPRLLVLRGQKRNVEYPLYEGLNFIGRADEKPVDIDLEEQEPPDRIWCSRQHACVSFEDNVLAIEDLNSANGTYVNRTRVYPGSKRPLAVNDVIQIGNVQMRVVV